MDVPVRRLAGRFARLPIRARLTVVSAAATAALFGVLGLVLYLQFQSSLNTSIDSALRARATELRALSATAAHPVAAAGSAPAGTRAAFAQVLAEDGRVLDATPDDEDRPLLGPAERRRALEAPLLLDRHERSRLYALRARDGNLIVVGVTLRQQQEAFITFNWELIAGAPLMVLIAAVITYVVGGKLLAPVERMRQRAERISAGDLDARLPLPESVDEIHHLAMTLNEMLDRLQTGVRRELTFVSDASHELRTPLAVLKGELEVALRVDGSRSEWREAAASAVEETDRLIVITEGLLTLARAHDGELPLAPEPLDVCELCHHVADRARAMHGTAPKVQCAPGTEVLADRPWLEQALLNLVHNAVRHGDGEVVLAAVDGGGRRGPDRTDDGAGAGVDPGRVELHVRDRGPGFPDSFLPHAFERFSRADAARGRGGAGLGLSIVETIARAHGGDVGAANRPEGGADVWLSLPRVPIVNRPAAPPRAARPATH